MIRTEDWSIYDNEKTPLMQETQTAIKASELRIGNWVIAPKTTFFIEDSKVPFHEIPSQYKKVESVSDEGINIWMFATGEPEFTFDQIQPIPLTPEILEKCGFVHFADSEMIFELETEDNLFYLRKSDNVFRSV